MISTEPVRKGGMLSGIDSRPQITVTASLKNSESPKVASTWSSGPRRYSGRNTTISSTTATSAEHERTASRHKTEIFCELYAVEQLLNRGWWGEDGAFPIRAEGDTSPP